jgi:phosphatidyl-myo-inositol dimannoside synthase
MVSRPDLLLGTGLSGVWVSAALSMVHQLPMLAVAHGSELAMPSRLVCGINRWAFGRARAVVAVSQFTHGMLQQAGIRPRRIEVIPNAADPAPGEALAESECESFRQRAGFNGARLLLTVGHVSERKGQEVVIRALPQILRKAPDAHYLMIGLPTLQQQLSRLVQQLGIGERVHFLGRVPEEEKVRWLNCCDVFLMTSRTTRNGDCEGFGIGVVEAALCGKPAVVSAQSGLIEAIQDGITGIAVPEGDETATAEAVISLLIDPARRENMGRAARTRALREQTWETCAAKYDTLLREMLR